MKRDRPLTPASALRPARAFRWRRGERLGYAMVSPVVLSCWPSRDFRSPYNLWNSFRNYNLYYPVAGNPFVGSDKLSKRVHATWARGRDQEHHRVHRGVRDC